MWVKCNRFITFKPSRTRGSSAKFSFHTPKTSQRAKFFTVRAGYKYLKLSKKSKIPMSLSAAKKHFRWMHLNETSTVFLFILWDWPKLFPSSCFICILCCYIVFFFFTGNHQMMFHDFRLLFPHLNAFVS